jgi:hypothetical protein
MADSTRKVVRSVLTGESEEDVARLEAGAQVREDRLAELGFTEHRWKTWAVRLTVSNAGRAWLSTDEDDLRVTGPSTIGSPRPMTVF